MRALHKKKQDLFLDDWCATAHPPLNNVEKAKKLATAVGKEKALDALREVAFRMENPNVADRVTKPWGLARAIGECYRGTCRDESHGDLHEEAARGFHRGRRVDYDQKARASLGARPEADPEVRRVADEERRRAEVLRELAEYEASLELSKDGPTNSDETQPTDPRLVEASASTGLRAVTPDDLLFVVGSADAR